jgi:hypothetical protein
MVESSVVGGEAAPKLTAAQRKVLAELARKPGQDVASLATMTKATVMGVGRVVEGLRAKGLISYETVPAPMPGCTREIWSLTLAGATAIAPRPRAPRAPKPRVEIVRLDENDLPVLYHRYPNQTQAQPCYVELDCAARRLQADWNGEVGNAVPADVWHGHRRRYAIPCLRPAPANALLDRIAPLAARVCDGYRSRWNGSDHVACFTEDAEDAERQIRALCEGADPEGAVKVWDASEWFRGIGPEDRQRAELGIDADTTDEELDSIAVREMAEAQASGECHWIDGLDNHMWWLRNGA